MGHFLHGLLGTANSFFWTHFLAANRIHSTNAATEEVSEPLDTQATGSNLGTQDSALFDSGRQSEAAAVAKCFIILTHEEFKCCLWFHTSISLLDYGVIDVQQSKSEVPLGW